MSVAFESHSVVDLTTVPVQAYVTPSLEEVNTHRQILIRHLCRVQRTNQVPFETPRSSQAKARWLDIVRGEALSASSSPAISDIRVAIFSTRQQPMMLRTFQNEVLLGLPTVEQKLAFVRFMLLYRVCAVDPAWIHTFLECFATGDQRVIEQAVQTFTPVWMQMKNVHAHFSPVSDLLVRNRRRDRCLGYLWSSIEQHFDAVEPARQPAIDLLMRIFPTSTRPTKPVEYRTQVGQKRTFACATADENSDLECPVCYERVAQTKHVVLACGHALCRTCMEQMSSRGLADKCCVCKQPFSMLGQECLATSLIGRVEYFDREGRRVATLDAQAPKSKWILIDSYSVRGRADQPVPDSIVHEVRVVPLE